MRHAGVTQQLDAAHGARRGTRRSPSPGGRALDASGAYGGPGFIGRRLDAVHRMRGFAAILRGGLLRCRETCRRPVAEPEPKEDSSGQGLA